MTIEVACTRGLNVPGLWRLLRSRSGSPVTAPAEVGNYATLITKMLGNCMTADTSCVFTRPARDFAAKHALALVDVDLLGFWNSGTPLTSFLELDIGRSGNHPKLSADG